jgi:hypothetical protein
MVPKNSPQPRHSWVVFSNAVAINPTRIANERALPQQGDTVRHSDCAEGTGTKTYRFLEIYGAASTN